MMINIKIKDIIAVGVYGVIALLGTLSDVGAQGFINREFRPDWGQKYENFGDHDLRKYPESLADRYGIGEGQSEWLNPTVHGPADPVTYDQLGNFMLPGDDVYNLNWDRSIAGAYGKTVGQDDFYGAQTQRIFNNLMIVSDEYANWQTKFMVGSSIRAYFTPSTMKLTNFNGVRWDSSSRMNSFSFVASPGSRPGNPDVSLPSPSDYRNMFGAYWESTLGDILKLGGTFVMRQRGTLPYSNNDISMGLLGLSDFDLTRYVYVVITDDSPEDPTHGARVYDVRPIVNGVEANLSRRVTYLPDLLEMKKYTNSGFQEEYAFEGKNGYFYESIDNVKYSDGSWFQEALEGQGSISDPNNAIYKQLFLKASGAGTIGYVNVPDPNNPDDVTGRLFAADMSQGYIDLTGTDVLVYEFEIPPGTRKLEFDCHVANDYVIDIVAVLPTVRQKGAGDIDDPDANKTDYWKNKWLPIFDFKNAAKAPGEVSDFSNDSWVRVSYDRLTGISVYGLNLQVDWRGLSLNAEVNEYQSYWAYPIRESLTGESTATHKSRAWYVNFEQKFNAWSFGAEFFDYPLDYMRYWAPIDDNDDNNSSSGGSEYPGLNINWDRGTGNQYIDTYWTGQPYITYYFDNITFGDDFNHNGIIDERENDNLADLPYDRDSSGQHFFLKLNPWENTQISFGHYDITQEYRDGENRTNYLKFEHYQRLGNVFEYGLYHRTERVFDNYKSHTQYNQYQEEYNTLSGGTNGTSTTTLYFNNLAFRNSWYNTSFLRTRFTPIDNLNITNNFKYDVISRQGDLQVDDSWIQQQYTAPPRNIETTSHVHMIDYMFRVADLQLIPEVTIGGIRILSEKRLKEFRFIPQFKYESVWYTADFMARRRGGHYYSYFPVLRFDYRVAPNTLLRCAMQGIPGLMEVRRDSADQIQDVNRRRMFLGFETTTLYSGFNLLVTTGVRRDKQEWVNSLGRPEEGQTQYFIQLQVESGR